MFASWDNDLFFLKGNVTSVLGAIVFKPGKI